MSNLGTRGWRPFAALLTGFMALTLVLATPGTSSAAAPQAGSSPLVAKSDAGLMKSRVSGTTEDGRQVKGTFTPSEFTVTDGVLMVTGTVDGRILGHGEPQTFSEPVTTTVEGVAGDTVSSLGSGARGMPAAAVGGSCDILNLDLGPLDLDVLGLQVHLDEVVLDIVAQSGAGNLLGNLLCAVAGLLDGGPLAGLLDQVAGLLNQILGALNL